MRCVLLVATLILITAPVFAQTSSSTDLPADLEPITAMNVDRLERLGRYGQNGLTLGVTLFDSPSGHPTQEAGFWLYEAEVISLGGSPLVFQRYAQMPFVIRSNGEQQDESDSWVAQDSNGCLLYDSNTERVIIDFCPADATPFKLVFSPDLNWVATIQVDGNMSIGIHDVRNGWIPESEADLYLFFNHDYAAFSPNGSLLLFQPYGQEIRLIETSAGELVDILPGGSSDSTLEKSAFSADGSVLAYITECPQQCLEVLTTIHIWDVEAGTEKAAIDTFGLVDDVELSTDGSLLLVQYARDLTLYDADNGDELLTLPGFASAFSTDGRVLYVRGYDGRAELWGVPADQ